MEEAPGGRHQGAGIIGEASWRRHHGGGIHLRFSPPCQTVSKTDSQIRFTIFVDLGWLRDSILVPFGLLLMPWEGPWDHPGAP